MAVTKHRTQVRHARQESRERILAAFEELVRRRSFDDLSVDEVMREAGFGRTIFYRHFDDLADVLLNAGREAITEVFEAQTALRSARTDASPESIRQALEPAVEVYRRHGPLIRAITEAARTDELIAERYRLNRARFDGLVEEVLRGVAARTRIPLADVTETARALNALNESYLLDAFGREPRVTAEVALQALTEIWVAVMNPSGVDQS